MKNKKAGKGQRVSEGQVVGTNPDRIVREKNSLKGRDIEIDAWVKLRAKSGEDLGKEQKNQGMHLTRRCVHVGGV